MSNRTDGVPLTRTTSKSFRTNRTGSAESFRTRSSSRPILSLLTELLLTTRNERLNVATMRTYFDACAVDAKPKKRCFLWVEPSSPGVFWWIAASKRYDVMAQGKTPMDAKRMLFKVVQTRRWLIQQKKRENLSRPIQLTPVRPLTVPPVWRATSRRYGVSAYGRTVSEAKQRLFITSMIESCNRFTAQAFSAVRGTGKTPLYWRNGMLVGHTGQVITSADVQECM